MHRLDLRLYSHPKKFLENGVRTHVISKGKIPSAGNSEEDETHDTASRRTASPTHYPLSYSCLRSFFHSVHVFYGLILMLWMW